MRNPELFEFTVEGSGRFPIDMLRYDFCWPMAQADSAAISTARGRRRVVLQTSNPHAPTAGRWDSFNWRVVDPALESA